MGTKYRWAKLEPSRELCGATPDEFAGLIERLAPLWEQRRRELESRPDRKRAPGAGRKPTPLWVQLLATMTMWRQGSTTRAMGLLFGVDARSIRRWRDGVEDLLLAHGFQPPGAKSPIRSVEDLVAYVEENDVAHVAVDGTEVRRNSPVDYQAQKAAYSGKTKDHVVKASIVADPARRPLWFAANPTGEGRTHDITMLRAQTELLAALALVTGAGVLVLADKAYSSLDQDLGLLAVVGTKKPRNRERSMENRLWNRALSSIRMPVEHAIGRLKWWAAMRYWRRPADRFDRGGRAIAILTSLL
jgi:hypothetical protein